MEAITELWHSTGLYNFIVSSDWIGLRQFIMIGIGLLLVWLAIKKEFEPLLLLPIGFGGILANIPVANMTHFDENGFLAIIAALGLKNGPLSPAHFHGSRRHDGFRSATR